MDSKELVDELFRLDEHIRWVGIADQQGNILQNAQRRDVESLTDKNTDELTLHVFPTIVGLLWGRLVGTGIGDLLSSRTGVCISWRSTWMNYWWS